MSVFEDIMRLSEEELDKLNAKLEPLLNYEEKQQVNENVNKDESQDRVNEITESGMTAMTGPEIIKRRKENFNYYARSKLGLLKVPLSELLKHVGGNKKNKPKIYKNKIIQGKERNIYKIPGSRKDYIKYKGAFIAVNDYIKSKNK